MQAAVEDTGYEAAHGGAELPIKFSLTEFLDSRHPFLRQLLLQSVTLNPVSQIGGELHARCDLYSCDDALLCRGDFVPARM
jgi:hypothetical protein